MCCAHYKGPVARYEWSTQQHIMRLFYNLPIPYRFRTNFVVSKRPELKRMKRKQQKKSKKICIKLNTPKRNEWTQSKTNKEKYLYERNEGYLAEWEKSPIIQLVLAIKSIYCFPFHTFGKSPWFPCHIHLCFLYDFPWVCRFLLDIWCME